jgi:DNA-directed RNA polymerase subunit H (RpoH/RPB5)
VRSALYSIAEELGYKNLPQKIQDYEDMLKEIHVILIYNSKNKNDTENRFFKESPLEEIYVDNKNLELFPVHKITFNITKHVKSPQYFLLTKKQKNQIRDKYNVGKGLGNFERINLNDAAARYYDAHENDMFLIIRKGQDIAYRVVGKRVPAKK